MKTHRPVLVNGNKTARSELLSCRREPTPTANTSFKRGRTKKVPKKKTRHEGRVF